MRLSTDQIQAIRQAATDAFGQGTAVWLFGTPMDDAKKAAILTCWSVLTHFQSKNKSH
jgi:hypothetical protein